MALPFTTRIYNPNLKTVFLNVCGFESQFRVHPTFQNKILRMNDPDPNAFLFLVQNGPLKQTIYVQLLNNTGSSLEDTLEIRLRSNEIHSSMCFKRAVAVCSFQGKEMMFPMEVDEAYVIA